jgi:hypothetical protein
VRAARHVLVLNRMKLSLRLLLASVPLAGAILCFSGVAKAQSVTIAGPLTRSVPRGSLPAHPSGVAADVINYSDCAADELLEIPLSITAGANSGDTIEVWAGEGTTDCASSQNRMGNTAQCWRVASGIPTLSKTSAKVRAQDVLSQFGKAAKEPAPLPADASVCESPIIGPGAHVITLSILLVNGQTAEGTAATLPVIAALQGPTLGTIAVSDGDGAVKVLLPVITDTSATGVRIYCDSTSPKDSLSACTSAVLASDRRAPPPEEYACASVDSVTTAVTVNGLKNDVTVTVAAAATDRYGNIGPLSPLACARPTAAPQEGARSCAVSRVGANAGAASFGASIALAAVLMRRRRRARRVS